MYQQMHELGNNNYYYYAKESKPKESKKGFLKSSEKFLNKSLKTTTKNLNVLFKKFVILVTPAEPPLVQDIVFMTYILRVPGSQGWQRSILAVLKKTKIVRDFNFLPGGLVSVSASADLKTVLKGLGKANVEVVSMQTSRCSSNMFIPRVGGQGYGYGYGGGDNYSYNGYGNGMPPYHGGYGGGYGYGNLGYGNGGMYPFHGGYGGAQGSGYGYNPMGYNNNYMPFNNRQGMNYMAPQAQAQAQQPFVDDERLNNCPCDLS